IRRGSKHRKSSSNVYCANAGFHRSDPIGAEIRRVCFVPGRELKQKLFGVALIPRKQVCAPQCHQGMKSIEVPDDTNVSPLGDDKRYVAGVTKRPSYICLWVTVPIKPRT